MRKGGVWAAILFFFCAHSSAPLLAHPHVYVDVDMRIETTDDGGLTRIHYDWTFDDLYSAFAIQGLQREQGRPSRQALAKLAREMVERLDEVNFFTQALAPDHELQPLGAENVEAHFESDRLRLSFTLAMRSFTGAATQVDLRVFDPQYMVAMSLTEKLRIEGPPHCRLDLRKPGSLDSSDMRQLDDSIRTNQLPDGFGAKLASMIRMDCSRAN
jgi:ABC-type uncharacterized transport system substrate-binding protein